MEIVKVDVIHWMKKKYPDNPEYFWDMDKVLEVINEHISAVEEQRINRAKRNGFSGRDHNHISAWATDKATDFDGPLDDDGLKDAMEYAYKNGQNMADAIEGYLMEYITGESFSNAYKELPDMARTLLDGMIEEINWTEVAEHYIGDMNFICPVCKREDCEGKDDEDYCENSEVIEGKRVAVCPECKLSTCPNADGSAEEECTTVECPCCCEKDCPGAASQDETDCVEYDPERIHEDDYIDSSDGMFVGPDGKEGRLTDEEILTERKKELTDHVYDQQILGRTIRDDKENPPAINYADVEALGGWDKYFALRDKFKPEEKNDGPEEQRPDSVEP